MYSSSPMYLVINFRGVQQIFLPFSRNKVANRDNLRARGMAKPLECELCIEIEYDKHICFFNALSIDSHGMIFV